MQIKLSKNNIFFGANWSKYLQNQFDDLERAIIKSQDFYEIGLFRAKKKIINDCFQHGTIYNTATLDNSVLKNSYYLKVNDRTIHITSIPQSATKKLNMFVINKIATKLSKISRTRG